MSRSWGKWGKWAGLTRLARLTTLKGVMGLMGLMGLIGHMGVTSCSPEPPLHLYDVQELSIEVSVVNLDLEGYWETLMDLSTQIDLDANWYYGWDEIDIQTHHSLIGYTKPDTFEVRRYYTGETPYAPHTSVIPDTLQGQHYQRWWDWGFWDMLLWNRITTHDGVQSLVLDETSSLDSVIAYTNPTMRITRFNAPAFTHAFNAPEELFSAYKKGIEINKNLDGFVYDEKRDVWVRTDSLKLRPVTYIYLTQVILHNNNGRITSIDGNADISGMARSTNLNTGIAGNDAITVYFNANLKKDCDMNGELVDIIGGRVLTFGPTGVEAKAIEEAKQAGVRKRAQTPLDKFRHYMDFTMQFNNGHDSTFVFDITDQVQKQHKGGIITIELNVDTIPIPSRSGGSGFDAVVKDTEDGGTWEFDM
jgi:hypothetical protein